MFCPVLDSSITGHGFLWVIKSNPIFPTASRFSWARQGKTIPCFLTILYQGGWNCETGKHLKRLKEKEGLSPHLCSSMMVLWGKKVLTLSIPMTTTLVSCPLPGSKGSSSSSSSVPELITWGTAGTAEIETLPLYIFIKIISYVCARNPGKAKSWNANHRVLGIDFYLFICFLPTFLIHWKDFWSHSCWSFQENSWVRGKAGRDHKCSP